MKKFLIEQSFTSRVIIYAEDEDEANDKRYNIDWNQQLENGNWDYQSSFDDICEEITDEDLSCGVLDDVPVISTEYK